VCKALVQEIASNDLQGGPRCLQSVESRLLEMKGRHHLTAIDAVAML
jgi:hypothetical protein